MNNRIENTCNYLYIIVFGIFLVYILLNTTSFFKTYQISPHTKYVEMFFILIFLIKSFMDSHSQIEFVTMIFLILLSIIIYVSSTDLVVLLDMSFIFAAKNVNFIKLIRVYFYIFLFIILITLVASFFKILPNEIFIRGDSIRNTFGFVYPVSLSESITVASISYFIINFNKKITYKSILVLILLAYFIIHYTGTRMDYYCILMLLFIVMLRKMCPNVLNKFPFNCSWLSLIIMSIITFYYSYNFNFSSKFYYNFNNLSERRLMYSHIALRKYGLSLFGKRIYENESANGNNLNNGSITPSYFYIDQSVIRIAILYGVIILLIFLLAFSFKMYKLHVYHMNYFVLLFTILVIRSFFDTNIFQINGNPFLIILFSSLVIVKHTLKSTHYKQLYY